MKRFEKLGGENKAKGKGAAALELAPEFTEGLTQEEVVTMMLNYASCCMLGNRMDAVEQTAKSILKLAPDNVGAAVFHAVSLAKKDQLDQALKVLDDFASKHEDGASVAKMAQCELACSHGKYKLGAQALVGLSDEVKYQPGALATIISLFGKSNDPSQASSTVDGATQWWEGSLSGASQAEMKKYVNVMSIAAQFKFQQKDVDTAAALYQKVLRQTDDPTLRSQAMGGLVQLHGVEDASLADQYEGEMPAIPGLDEIDVEILEQTTISKSTTKVEESGESALQKTMPGMTESSSAAAQETYIPKTKAEQKRDFLKTLPAERQEFVLERQRTARQNKRKRKVAKENAKHPKPKQIDPERWIPKRDRTSYKKTRKEKLKAKNKVKGSQGAGKVDESLDRSAGQSSSKGPKLPKGKGKRRK
jgi:signal recognition particle subunit SRP72